jgi:hypothetical protein
MAELTAMVTRTPGTPHGNKTAVCSRVSSRWLAQDFRDKTRRIAALWTSPAAVRQCCRRLKVFPKRLLCSEMKLSRQNVCFGLRRWGPCPGQPLRDLDLIDWRCLCPPLQICDRVDRSAAPSDIHCCPLLWSNGTTASRRQLSASWDPPVTGMPLPAIIERPPRGGDH